MPKKRISTAKSREASRRNLVRARYFQSFSAPKASTFKHRTSKVMGKAGQHHSGGTVTLAPWAEEALAGRPITSSKKLFADSTIRGQITQAKGEPYRRTRKQTKKAKAKLLGVA